MLTSNGASKASASILIMLFVAGLLAGGLLFFYVNYQQVSNQNGKISINVQTAALPGSSSASSADVLIAVADDTDVSNIAGGENSGKTLTNVAVVRELKSVGKIDKTNGFSKDVETSISANTTNKSRIIVIVQEPHQGRLLGVASTQYPI